MSAVYEKKPLAARGGRGGGSECQRLERLLTDKLSIMAATRRQLATTAAVTLCGTRESGLPAIFLGTEPQDLAGNPPISGNDRAHKKTDHRQNPFTTETKDKEPEAGV
ncbi:MAG: hypothetical protein PHW10_02815 [Candidatus Peribacteraceae bacterium]|nr:hypothetical protein [Candidatus Peribacteraceae bacterium]